MMFKRNVIRGSDPFRLSLAGRCHAMIAWLRGPALMRRWLLLLLGGACVASVAGVVVIAVIMQAASSVRPAVPEAITSNVTLMRTGPGWSQVTPLPGYDCHPEPNRKFRYVNPMVIGPAVVAMDKDGVVWGPDCVVTYGTAGS